MKPLLNGGRLCETTDDLPDLRNAKDLVADFETTSMDDRKDSLNPWKDCWALGIAVTTLDAQGAWYVPLRHRMGGNVPLEQATNWWHDVVGTARCWTNHNIKYDAHVSANDLGWAPEMELYDTLTHAKIVDSDRHLRGGYGLDALSSGWLHHDIGPYEHEIKRWLGDRKDYGCVAVQPMAEYACQDVITTKWLKKYIEQQRHSDCDRVARMETELTSVLYETERNGMRVERVELLKEELAISLRLLEIDAELVRLCGRSVNPRSNDQLYDLLINQYGLPVLGWTEEIDGQPAGNPSFDKEALILYSRHPLAPHAVVELILEARVLSQTLSLFVKPYQDLADARGRLHGNFNQCVRTGRLSMSAPNLQQCSKRAKALIHPDPGNAFVSADQSQIEFRVIVHYIQNRHCIDAYRSDPDTDFHEWVAQMSGMKRKPAKTMNFMMGYGGGKKKAVRTLAMNSDVVGGIIGRVDQMVAEGRVSDSQREQVLEAMCRQKAEGVYCDYHNALPELKPTSRRATAVCYERGYVRNVHGRHRHLPQQAAHRAFNSLCQGEAADIQKERTVALARMCRGTEIMLVGNVHDQVVLEGPAELMEDRETQEKIAQVLESPDTPLAVPLRCAIGCSRVSWADADSNPKPLHYERRAECLLS